MKLVILIYLKVELMKNKLFNSTNKSLWHDYILSKLTSKLTHTLVLEDNTLPYRWLEPIGKEALSFDRLLKTNRIKEDQLIGIDNYPGRENDSLLNVLFCKDKFNRAIFINDYWADYCNYEAPNDIGYIIHDLYDSIYGKTFEKNLKATVRLVDRCYDNIGEVFLVINVDYDASNRYGKRNDINDFLNIIKKTFRNETNHLNLKNINITSNQIYKYKQSYNSDKMISAHIICH